MKTRESGMPPEETWQSFFDPLAILTKLGLDANCSDVLEFGCGYGTFAIPAAQMIRGKVYAMDIRPEMLAITWNFDASTPRGPSMSIRPTPGQCRAWAEEAGFAAISPTDIELPPYHYGLVLESSH